VEVWVAAADATPAGPEVLLVAVGVVVLDAVAVSTPGVTTIPDVHKLKYQFLICSRSVGEVHTSVHTACGELYKPASDGAVQKHA
jgi:hypothetical protein